MKKIRNHLWIIFLVFCVCIIIYAAFQIYRTQASYREAQDTYSEVVDQFVTPVTVPPTEATVPSKEHLSTTPTEGPTRLEEYAPIQVDFNSLQEEYEDIVGWIYCPDTVINYPVVQTDNNDFYLDHMANGYYNYTGSIFLDYRCSSDFSDFNSVIYGHNMRDYTMFAPLHNYQDPDFAENHPVMYLLTPEEDYEIRIFSAYVTRATAEIYDYAFMPRMRNSFLNLVLENSEIDASIDMDQIQRTIMLSTCDYSTRQGRYVVIGCLTPLSRP